MIFFASNADTAKSAEAQKEGFRVAAPFSTAAHGLAFAAMVALFFAGPTLMQAVAPADPVKVYRGIPLNYGNYFTVGRTIADGGELDVLILGASDGWTGLDPAVLAEELGKSLGRPARVMNFGTNWAGEERFAQIVHDLLGRVKARLVIGFENDAAQTFPHELAKFWWRGAASTSGLDWRQRLQLHMMQVLGWPRQLWGRFVLGESQAMNPSYQAYAKSFLDNRGFNAEARGWRSHFEPNEANRRPMPAQEPPQPPLNLDEMFFKGGEDADFRLQYYTYTPFQSHFYRQVNALVKAQGGVYATMALPTHFRDKPLDKVVVRELADKQPRDWPVVGIAQTRMFPGFSFEEMKNFYSNESHLNAPGARAFTRAVMPAIRKLYEQAPAR